MQLIKQTLITLAIKTNHSSSLSYQISLFNMR